MLTINDIREWLLENRAEYKKMKAAKYPDFRHPLFFTYYNLREFISYYKYRYKCDQALKELVMILKTDSSDLSGWTRRHEVLGSQDLLMFEINYFDWYEHVENDCIKIEEGIYTARKPFQNILCFCKLFQLLYWDFALHEEPISAREKEEVLLEARKILMEHYIKE